MNQNESSFVKILILINIGFGLVYFIIINSDVALVRTARELNNCMPYNIVEVLCKNSLYMVHLCMLSVHVRRHQMAELLTHLRYSHY